MALNKTCFNTRNYEYIQIGTIFIGTMFVEECNAINAFKFFFNNDFDKN